MSTEESTSRKIRINQQNLYREEVITDLRTGAIRQLTPVKPNGESDKGRKILFFGQTQLMSEHGPFPIQFPIDARNLHEALEKFPDVLDEFVAKLAEQAREMQRQEQSRIIVPGGGSGESKLILK